MPQAPPTVGSKHSVKKITDNMLFVIIYATICLSSRGANHANTNRTKDF